MDNAANDVVKAVIDAMSAGTRAAKQMVPGTVFRGAMPEAEAKGYVKGTPEYRAFISGFLARLDIDYPRGVLVRVGGVIVGENKN
jgi:hypothetical protein